MTREPESYTQRTSHGIWRTFADINKLFAVIAIPEKLIPEMSNPEIPELRDPPVELGRSIWRYTLIKISHVPPLIRKGLYCVRVCVCVFVRLSTCVSAGDSGDALEIKRIADNEDGN